MLKCLKSELLLLKTKRHYFDVGSIAHNGKIAAAVCAVHKRKLKVKCLQLTTNAR